MVRLKSVMKIQLVDNGKSNLFLQFSRLNTYYIIVVLDTSSRIDRFNFVREGRWQLSIVQISD